MNNNIENSIKHNIYHILIDSGNVLSSYLSIHNDIFNFSIRKIIPIPFIFKKINYDKHYYSLNNIIDRLNNIIGRADILLNNKICNADEIVLLNTSKVYMKELLIAIESLMSICYKMMMKINGNKYDMKEYNKDCIDYENVRHEYCEIGKLLNIQCKNYLD